MRLRSLFGPYWVTAPALCFTLGCPQMLEDEFEMAPRVGVGGSVASGGTGSAPDSGAGIVPDLACGPGGVRGPNGDCYASGNVEKTWSGARESCQGRGENWDLATIRGAGENDFVLAITGFEAWIGATDETNEGTWRWVLDEDPFFDVDAAVSGAIPYTNWNTNEPNDADNSDCLRILTTGLWADWECGSAKGYVCQQLTP